MGIVSTDLLIYSYVSANTRSNFHSNGKAGYNVSAVQTFTPVGAYYPM